jgi:hypothetical protein
MVIHTCYPTILGRWNHKGHNFKTNMEKVRETLSHKQNMKQKGWGGGGAAPVLI